MSRIRKMIADRLVEVKNTTASLTTCKEVDMSAVIKMRQQYKESFQERYNAKLGFMSFFVKAVVESLKACPELNAEIRDGNIVYRNYFDISIAVGGGKGLVVPVIRNAELLSFAEIEQTIADFGARAKTGQLKPDELTGGTFTITNGGVYGSTLSTPILNPPQSGILGLHGIEEKPVVRDGQIVIRPIMWIALTYDHRIVDGREAVGFAVRVKEYIEEPTRLLFGL
jgi:2-oxoglutarate dehydrogenase E2 component (dihydrolipoamide succinyltransferase)